MASLTMDEVLQHRSRDDLWIVHENKVYEVTDFAGRHPGGANLLLEKGGQEISDFMRDPKSHAHSKFAYQIMNKFYIGELIDNNNTKISHNGVANGKANGVANGMSNGMSNGKPNGVNGVSNGIANGVIHRKKDQGTLRAESETGGKTMLGWREEELVDWDKPLLWQVGSLGKDYLEWVHSPVDKHVRLFESNALEYFADNYWWYIPLIWLPVTGLFILTAISHMKVDPDLHYLPLFFGGFTMTLYHIPFALVAGVICWTLAEYTLHRWLFHLAPPEDSPVLITLHFLLHGQHHKAPFDKYRLVFPPAMTCIFVFGFYMLAHSLMAPALAYCILAGMMFGYICYDCTHYYLHHGTPFLSYFRGLKQYHIKHHFINQQKGFGISSKLWDYPFQTVLPVDGKHQ